jgi:hypothetical protein
MKYFKHFTFITLFVVLTSCSSDKETVTDDNSNQFELFINGVLVSSQIGESVFKTEGTINLGGLSFNTSGQFGYFSLDLITGSPNATSQFYSFRGYSSNYFDFNLESIDEVKKRVKGTFSGYVYANPFDINSEKKFVSGSFNTKYKDVLPAITNLRNKAKINGNQWTSSNKYLTREVTNYNQITQHDLSDDPFKIMIKYDFGTITEGTYNFINSNISNKIQLAKFDILTQTFVSYDCAGTLNITDKTEIVITGNYNFTAIHPITGEIITVSEGDFRLINRPF